MKMKGRGKLNGLERELSAEEIDQVFRETVHVDREELRERIAVQNRRDMGGFASMEQPLEFLVELAKQLQQDFSPEVQTALESTLSLHLELAWDEEGEGDFIGQTPARAQQKASPSSDVSVAGQGKASG